MLDETRNHPGYALTNGIAEVEALKNMKGSLILVSHDHIL